MRSRVVPVLLGGLVAFTACTRFKHYEKDGRWYFRDPKGLSVAALSSQWLPHKLAPFDEFLCRQDVRSAPFAVLRTGPSRHILLLEQKDANNLIDVSWMDIPQGSIGASTEDMVILRFGSSDEFVQRELMGSPTPFSTGKIAGYKLVCSCTVKKKHWLADDHKRFVDSIAVIVCEQARKVLKVRLYLDNCYPFFVLDHRYYGVPSSEDGSSDAAAIAAFEKILNTARFDDADGGPGCGGRPIRSDPHGGGGV
jgi:hypothetical protein